VARLRDGTFRKYSKRYFGPGFDWRLFKADSHADHVREFMLGSYNAGRTTLLRAQAIAHTHALDARIWPSIDTVVPRWRYDETLGYLTRVMENLAAMDSHGRVVDP
jgi:hypothetical protein